MITQIHSPLIQIYTKWTQLHYLQLITLLFWFEKKKSKDVKITLNPRVITYHTNIQDLAYFPYQNTGMMRTRSGFWNTPKNH